MYRYIFFEDFIESLQKAYGGCLEKGGAVPF